MKKVWLLLLTLVLLFLPACSGLSDALPQPSDAYLSAPPTSDGEAAPDSDSSPAEEPDSLQTAIGELLEATLQDAIANGSWDTLPEDWTEELPADWSIFSPEDESISQEPDRTGTYSTRDEVALYLYTYGELPPNFLTKSEATALGWDSGRGNLWEVAPGAAIGGDVFGNREQRLPGETGRRWYECDIDYDGGYRGAKRIVFSSDGLIYYTEDHYETFTLLYEGWSDPEYRYR